MLNQALLLTDHPCTRATVQWEEAEAGSKAPASAPAAKRYDQLFGNYCGEQKYMDKSKCPVCGYDTDIQCRLDSSTLTNLVSCPRCGEFFISEELWMDGIPGSETLYVLSAVLRYNHDIGGQPIRVLASTVGSLVSGTYPRTVPELGRQLLRRLSLRTSHFGERIVLAGKTDYPIGYCRNIAEFDYILAYLDSRGWVNIDKMMGPHYGIRITPEGWTELEQSHRHDATNPRVFVAMSFSDDLKDTYQEGIDKTIRECGYRPIRVDREHFVNKIDDEIIAQIRQSRLVVADFTGHRGGVYFEAGFALGLGVPVIWMCSDNDKTDLHFDTRQYPHILWKKAADLGEQLRGRVLALLGRGPLDSYKDIA
ncbi:MAG TPA: hypothetical protein VI078_03210 [bacterium]